MKNNIYQNNYNQDTYQKFVNKISQITKYDKSSTNQQNRLTMAIDVNENKSEKYPNHNIPQNNESNDIKEQQTIIFQKMNQHLINRRRNADWQQNQNYTTNINVNGQNNVKNEIIQNKVFYDKNNINYNNNNNVNNPFKTNIKNTDNFQNNNSVNYQYQKNNNFNPTGNNVKNNQFQKNILENSYNYKFQKNISENSNNNTNQLQNDNVLNINNVENPNIPNKSSVCSSLLYGLLFGSVGTLLLWCRNPKVREYLKNCYQNVNIESVKNFFKMFLHPMDLIQKLGNKAGSLGEILKQSIHYLNEFIEEYSDLWRFLGMFLMIYILWFIIKKIIRKLIKSKNNQKKGN